MSHEPHECIHYDLDAELEKLDRHLMAVNPAYRRYSLRMDRFAPDFVRSMEAGWTRRMVVVATRKYRARKGR